MNQPSLRARLTIWFAASVLLILAPFLLGILALEWRSMRAALDHHLFEDLEVASEMLVVHGSELRWRMESDRDPGYDAGPQRWVEVYAEDGRVLLLRGVVAMHTSIRTALGVPSPRALGYRTTQTPAGAHVRTLVDHRTLGPRRVLLRVARPEDELRYNLRRLAWLFGLGAPLAVLAAALAGYVISGRMLAPLARMADRARAISAEHLSKRLPIDNPKDELGQLAAVFNDTFARLQAAFERLKRFTADVSHELRTPLTAIRSVGEVGLRESRDAAGYQEIIGSMLEEADRLTRVVDTLLALSRWESGRVRPQPEPVELRELVEEVAAQLSVLAEDRGVSIVVALAEPLRVSTDVIMTRQAVTNVVDNAIKFTRQGSRVRISSRSTESEHQLLVDDEGPGIPLEHREHVLERFYRIDDDRRPHAGGTGLGLAIAHWAVTANRGRITIDTSPAGGARIVLSLPRAETL